MWPFSLPVYFHWLMNCGCARLAILRIANADAGTVTSAIRASSQEMTNISVSTPTMVSSDVTQLAQRLLHRLLEVVDVVGDPAEDLAARLPVEVAQRQPGQLGLHVLAQPEHRALHQGRGQPALEQRADRAAHVQREHDREDLGDVMEVDAVPRPDADEHDVDRLAQHARPQHRQRDAADGEREREQHEQPVRAQHGRAGGGPSS